MDRSAPRGMGAAPVDDPISRRAGAVAAVPGFAIVGWTDDGGSLVVRSDRGGVPGLWVLSVEDAAWRPLVATGHPVGAARIVAGQGEVLYEQDRDGDEIHQLARVRIADGAVVPLAARGDVIHHLGPVAPDGRAVAYASNARDASAFDVRITSLRAADDRIIWAPGGFAYPGAFSPDGRLLAAGRLGAHSLETELVVLDLAGGPVTPVSVPSGAVLWGHVDGHPLVAWRPDGAGLLFGLNRDREFIGIAEWRPDGGEPVYLLEGEGDLSFSLDAAHGRLVVTENRMGTTRVTLRDLDSLAVHGTLALPSDGVAGDISVSPDGHRLAFVFQSPAEPPAIHVHDLVSGTRRILGAQPSRRRDWIPARIVTIPSFDGLPIQVQVHHPTATNESSPVAIVIHGGPELQAKQDFERHVQALAVAGFVVVRPNIRGSTGFGRRFAALDDGRLRLDAMRDLIAIHDWIAADGIGDPKRTVLWGMSYGGLIANLALAHAPDRWAAAVVGVAASSIVSFLEAIAPWRRPLREAEYGTLADDRAWLMNIAAIGRVADVRAPVYLVHAENDLRVPVTESRRLHAALAELGKDVRMRIFSDDGHHLDRVANHVTFVTEAIAFLREVVPGPHVEA